MIFGFVYLAGVFFNFYCLFFYLAPRWTLVTGSTKALLMAQIISNAGNLLTHMIQEMATKDSSQSFMQGVLFLSIVFAPLTLYTLSILFIFLHSKFTHRQGLTVCWVAISLTLAVLIAAASASAVLCFILSSHFPGLQLSLSLLYALVPVVILSATALKMLMFLKADAEKLTPSRAMVQALIGLLVFCALLVLCFVRIVTDKDLFHSRLTSVLQLTHFTCYSLYFLGAISAAASFCAPLLLEKIMDREMQESEEECSDETKV